MICVGLAAAGCAAPASGPPASVPASTVTVSASVPASADPSAGSSPGGVASSAATTSGSALPAWKSRKPDAPHDTPLLINGIPLINKLHPLSASYVPAWSTRPDGLSPEFAAAFKLLTADAARQGITLKVRSGYRNYAEQKASYEAALKTYDAATANAYYAPPGTSEHQTGLAADITDAEGHRGDAFRDTPAARYLAQHATDFGFIIRYPDGKQNITSIAWEPWHLRYVGPQVAAYFAAHPGLTLEEYLGDV